MRMTMIVLALLAGSAALAQAEPAPPAPNTAISVTTTSGVYSGTFVRERDLAGEIYWVITTQNGEVTISRAAIRNMQRLDQVQDGGKKDSGSGSAEKSPADKQAAEKQAAGSVELRFHGSNTIGAKLVPELAKAYAAKNGFAAEVVKPGATAEEFDAEYSKAESDQKHVYRFAAKGTGHAFTGLASKAADIGMASRPIKAEEQTAAANAGLGDLKAAGAENVIALDGVAVIVNPDNKIPALTLDQIGRIFAGEIKDWKDVGGAPGPITIYARDNKSGTFDTFKSLTLEPIRKQISSDAKRFESSEELSESVVRDPGGIGFLGLAYVGNARRIPVGTSCGLRFKADKFSIKAEEYPLSRRLFLYKPQTGGSPAADGFVGFALSAAAQPVIDQNGFINLDFDRSSETYVAERNSFGRVIGETPSNSSIRLMQSFSEKITDATRLSVTFRFRTASADLDNRALDDIHRLADFLRQQPDVAKSLMLFGFADQRGSPELNLDLSRRRAQQVADALATTGVAIPAAQVVGFGIIAPVACSDNEVALEKNRRVEVWFRP